MATDRISNLPNEILLQIFGYFCLHCQDEYNQPWDSRPLRHKPHRTRQRGDIKSWYSLDRHTLYSASLVSRRLRDIAQSVLYHEFALGHGDSWVSKLYTWQGRLASFMRCLTQRPDLAHSVRVCYVSTSLFETSCQEENRAVILEAARALDIDLPAAWRQRVSKASTHEKCDWPDTYEAFLHSHLDGSDSLGETRHRNLHNAFREGSEPGRRWMNAELVAMLIALMPNLDYISLQGNYRWPTHGLPHSALPALGVLNLPLKTLDLAIGGNPIIQLASGLETLNLHQHSFHGSPIPKMPKLKTLRVTDCLVSTKSLQELLAACTGSLTAFEFEAKIDPGSFNPFTSGNSSDHFQFSEAIEYLEGHKDTLKVLHLDLANRGFEMSKIPDDLDLKHFSVLEHVFLNSTVLFGHVPIAREHEVDHQVLMRLLPASIISLTARNDSRWTSCLEEALLTLAGWKSQDPQQFPNLKSIQSDIISMGTKSLVSLFGAVGVEFDIKVCLLSEVKPYLNGMNGRSDLLLPNIESHADGQ
ncbi:F-box domain-containing protein [Fusarium falciforme]|uniref:F-box domain-containing protein n=1 Tax=Fusarium falciforme TaxID=195108 RepID=UPI00230154EF|nr:F-box domain-containing protein [Fusarium falciforme]WAO90232.1 F-box domain-containing protein [Fusarium falciforme]